MVWTAIAAGSNAALKITVLIVLTRLLTPADFGVVSAALIVILIGSGVAQLGLGPALVQRTVLEPRHERTAFTASVLLGLVAGTLMVASAPWISAFFRMESLKPVIRALAVMFPLAGLAVTSDFLLQRELRFRRLARIDVLSYGLGYGLVGIGLAAWGWGVWALVAAQVAQAALRAALVLATRPPLIGAPNQAAFNELLGFGRSYTAAHLAVVVANYADNLVVGRWLGPAALGIYSRAYQLMAVPTAQLGDVLDNVLFPSMARVQHDVGRLSAAYLRGSALIALTMLPASAVLVVIAPELIRVALGERWMAVVLPFQVLAIAMMPRTSYRMSDSLARAVGIGAGRVWRQGAYGLLVFGGAWFGRRWGVPGVAWGVLCALLLNFLMMAHLALGITRVSWHTFWDTHLPALCFAAAVGGSAWLTTTLCRELGLPPAVRLAAVVPVAAGLAVLLLWRAPQAFLGPNGVLMLETMKAVIAQRFDPPARAEILDVGKP